MQGWVDDCWIEDCRCPVRMRSQPDWVEGCRKEVCYCISTKDENKSLRRLNIPTSVHSALHSLHCIALPCSFITVEPCQPNIPLTILEEKNKEIPNNFLWLLLHQLCISKCHSTTQKTLQENSLEGFQKHMIPCSILIPLVCGIPAFGTLPLMGYSA